MSTSGSARQPELRPHRPGSFTYPSGDVDAGEADDRVAEIEAQQRRLRRKRDVGAEALRHRQRTVDPGNHYLLQTERCSDLLSLDAVEVLEGGAVVSERW